MAPRIEEWRSELKSCRRVAFDTSVIIYFLEQRPPYSELVQPVVAAMEQGSLTATISTLVEAEVLVKPMRERNQVAIEGAELFFQECPNLVMRGVDRAVARRTAAVRARARLSLPDAVIVATALEEQCDALLGNDREVAVRAIGIPYLYLDNYLS